MKPWFDAQDATEGDGGVSRGERDVGGDDCVSPQV